MKHIQLFEEYMLINEIGEGSKPYPWKKTGFTKVESWASELSEYDKTQNITGNWNDFKSNSIMYGFQSDNASYYVRIHGGWSRALNINFGRKPGAPKPHDFNLSVVVSFDLEGRDDTQITNFGEQFRVISTVTDIVETFVKEISEWSWIKLQEIRIVPKIEDSEEGVSIAQSKRGRLYLEYIKKQGHRLPGSWTARIDDEYFTLLNGKVTGTQVGKYIPL